MKVVIKVIRIMGKDEEVKKKNQSTLEKIIAVSERQVSECRCDSCKSQCKTPCIGTPEDIKNLIEMGYKDKLAPTLWMHGVITGNLSHPVNMVQPIKTENGCIFFKNGLCELHDLGLKPTEGKLSYHTLRRENLDFDKSVTWNVAKEWLNTRNIPLIISILKTYLR